jgi:hypothetical protein
MHINWHWVALICVGVGLLFIPYWLVKRSKRDAESLRIWQLCRYQGGGKVYTPSPMHEDDAVEFASKLGSIVWVDREHGFIFYRPTSG